MADIMMGVRQYYARAAETTSPGMLPGTFKVLTTVARVGPITLSDLAERLAADRGMVSRQVSELDNLGFAERASDPSDGRVRLIGITALGRERLQAARGPHESRLGHILQDWPIDSIDRLSQLLGALAAGETPHPENPQLR